MKYSLIGWNFIIVFFFLHYNYYNRKVINSNYDIEVLKSIYNPSFRNTFGYYDSGGNRSISLMLAMDSWRKSDIEECNSFFLRALRESPNDLNIKFNYAKFLLSSNGNLSTAKTLLQDVVNVQSLHSESRLYLAYIALLNNQISVAETHLQSDYLDRKYPFMYINEFLLYKTDYFKNNYFDNNEEVQDYLNDLLLDIELSSIVIELLDPNISNKKEFEILEILRKAMFRFESFLMNELNYIEVKDYTKYTSRFSYGWRFWMLAYITSPTKTQKSSLEKILSIRFADQKICKLNKSTEGDCSLSDIESKMLQELVSTLDTDQVEKLEDYIKRVPWFLKITY